jgi:hypothetical protein
MPGSGFWEQVGVKRQVRYHQIKSQMRAGVRVPLDDFLFVKAIDQAANARHSFRRCLAHRLRSGNVLGGYGD